MSEVKKVFRINSISEIRHIKVSTHPTVENLKKTFYPRIESKVKEQYNRRGHYKGTAQEEFLLKMEIHYKKYNEAIQKLEQTYVAFKESLTQPLFEELISALNTAIMTLADLDLDLNTNNFEKIIDFVLSEIIEVNKWGIDIVEEHLITSDELPESAYRLLDIELFERMIHEFRNIYDSHKKRGLYDGNIAENLIGVLMDKKY